MMSWILSLSDAQLVALFVLALTALSLALRQLEVALRSRGWVRVAAGLAAIRGVIVDAPAVASRLVAMLRAREPEPTIPEVLSPEVVPPPERAPRQPPPGIGGIFLVLALTLAGCAGPLDGAKRAANAGHEIALGAAEVVRLQCTEKYKVVADKPALEALDKVCLPLATAYASVVLADTAARLTIQAVETGRMPTPLEALSAVDKLGEAVDRLRKAVQAFEEKP